VAVGVVVELLTAVSSKTAKSPATDVAGISLDDESPFPLVRNVNPPTPAAAAGVENIPALSIRRGSR
jgi:hypothetical protein